MTVVTTAVRLSSRLTGFILLLLVTQVQKVNSTTYTVGEYIQLSGIPTGTLASPNYPSNYPDYSNAIWVLEAPASHAVRLEISAVAAQGDETGYINVTQCNDYLEVRDGSAEEPLHFFGCHTNETVTVVSSNRWLWVRFYSDENSTNTGFSANFYVNDSLAAPLDVLPLKVCLSPQLTCRNRQCIPAAYRCDNINDCGCTGIDCDEFECGGLGWTMEVKVLAGVGIGAVIFFIVFFGVGAIDIYLKRRQEAENRRLAELENSRGRRRPKAPTLSMVVPQVKTSATPDASTAAGDKKTTITTIAEHDDSKDTTTAPV